MSLSAEELQQLTSNVRAEWAMHQASLDAYRSALSKGLSVVLNRTGKSAEVPPSEIPALIEKVEETLAELEARARLEIQDLKALRKAV